ncbi:uncharacterized protein LOC132736566 [Ruditapes philippinarum]|uniref:uncharacterized protein LOC132736566 n=1 Tax=Ruditapes philippinarum TaxID=129788 RepID=UPI00295AF8A6|nr:uncharacterized protein LOC132736566 [Ruditapes philippinarum]
MANTEKDVLLQNMKTHIRALNTLIGTYDKQSGQCYHCHQDGHFTRNCPQKNKDVKKDVNTGVKKTCYRCKQPGHFVSECPKPRKPIDPEYLKTVTCFNCHEKGHYSPDCPNRSKKDDTSPPSLFDENTVKYYGPTEKQQQYFGYGSTMNMAPPPPPPSTPVAQYSSDDTKPAQKPATESELLEYEEFARKHGHGAFVYFDKIHKRPKSPLPKGPITLGTLPPQPSTPVAQSDNTEPAQKPPTKPEFVYDEPRYGDFAYIENRDKHLSLPKTPPLKWTALGREFTKPTFDNQNGITLATSTPAGSTEPCTTTPPPPTKKAILEESDYEPLRKKLRKSVKKLF